MKTLTAIFFSLICTATFAVDGVQSISASQDDQVKAWADVDEVRYVKNKTENVKLFSVSGGDVAMNGSHLHVAVYANPQDGWKVFEVANVRDWKEVKIANKDMVQLKLTFDNMNAAGNTIKTFKLMDINLKNALTSDSIEINLK